MATVLRNTSPELAAMATLHNALKLQIGAASFFHLDKSERIPASASATDLPTALVRTNELINIFTFHFADLLAHKVVAVSTLPVVGAALDLATAITAANLMKASHNTECASTARHYTADGTNTTSSADATDLPSLLTLVNELVTDVTAHMASGPTCPSARVIAM